MHELFVPGRLCLFGEHSDWAGAHKQSNPNIPAGCCLVIPTMNLGLYATVRAIQEPVLRMKMTDECGNHESVELPMDIDHLLQEARRGGFWYYVAGTAYQVALSHHVSGGLEIDNYKTTLPLKKGLSSSAAVCVLVARAFNVAYGLQLTVRGEMELAYLGETTGPSMCGRMDQACAFNVPVLMRFDGPHLSVQQLKVTGLFCFAVVDLRAKKDTIRILSGLQAAYPHPENDVQRGLHDLLGQLNEATTASALQLLESGDAEALGALMTEAQANFDRLAGPLVPDQLGPAGSPVLHGLLSDPELRPFVWGGKGVGSQGDGSAQFLCKSFEDMERVLDLVKAKGMHAVPVVLGEI